jgi:hypothetical protein
MLDEGLKDWVGDDGRSPKEVVVHLGTIARRELKRWSATSLEATTSTAITTRLLRTGEEG